MIRALNDETFDQSVLEAAKLKKIFHERLPSWISYPDVDRAPWLNRAARQMWPFLNKAISNSVVWSVERPLNRLVDRSGPISSCKFSKFTLGLEPLIFVSVKAVDEVPNEIGLDIEFKWAALEPEVQLDVGLFDALKLPIAIEKIEAFGTIRLVFGPLCEWWPTFSDMQIAFIGKPTINFNLRLVGGDITKVPKVEKSLSKLIKNAIYNLMVWPNRLDIPITEQDGSIRIHHTGILRVTVYRFHGIYHSVKKVPKPALEIQLVDGDYEKPKVKRYTKTSIHDPKTDAVGEYVVEETFEIRVHDIRAAELKFTCVDTAKLQMSSFVKRNSKAMKKLKRAMPLLRRKKKTNTKQAALMEGAFAFDLKTKEKSKDTVLNTRDSKSSSAIEGERALKTQKKGTIGSCRYELGPLIETPNAEVPEDMKFDRPSKSASHLKDDKPGIVFSLHYLPFENEWDIENNINVGMQMPELDLEKLLATGGLDQFCGVLHVTLNRGDRLVARDANGRSDPFVRFSMGKQHQKSSVKYETLNPVWDEEFDFIIGKPELENNLKLRCECWDLDSYGKRDYMGMCSFDTKRIIAQLLIKGGTGQNIKVTEELQETPSGRLHVQFEFFSVITNRALTESIAEKSAAAQLANDLADAEVQKKQRGFSFKKLSPAEEARVAEEAKREIMEGMDDAATGGARASVIAPARATRDPSRKSWPDDDDDDEPFGRLKRKTSAARDEKRETSATSKGILKSPKKTSAQGVSSTMSPSIRDGGGGSAKLGDGRMNANAKAKASPNRLRCVLYTGPHTTALARWTPILKDVCRRLSPPTSRFQSPSSTPFNAN